MESLLKVTTSKWNMQSKIRKRVGEGQTAKRVGDRQRQIEGESLTPGVFLKSQMSRDCIEGRWTQRGRRTQKTIRVWKEDSIVGRGDLQISLSLSLSTFSLGDPYSEQYIWLSWCEVCKAGGGGAHLSVNGALCLASCLPCCLPSQACREWPPLRPSCFISPFHLPLYPSILALPLRGNRH